MDTRRRPTRSPTPDGQVGGAGEGARRSLPLAALRAQLDEASDRSRWTIDVDGVLGRSLFVDSGQAVTYRLRLRGELTLTSRVTLLPHDWRDGRGALRARVLALDERGATRELWTGTLRAGDRGRPRGLSVRCALPIGMSAIRLTNDAIGRLAPGSVTRALWVEPRLIGSSLPARSTDPELVGVAGDGDRPLISVLVPVHDPPRHMIQAAIQSVRSQTYPDWELCLVDDGSRDPEIITDLQHAAGQDPRITLIRHEHPTGISQATNAALAIARGQFVATLDHDDMLSPDALAHVAARIAAEPDLDMLYSDEDTVNERDQPIMVHLKPGWSPDTLRTNGYTCHLGVYRRELVREIGAFRTEFNGSQDVDMILRLVERTDRIAHIPRVLYHWRAHPASTAGGWEAKPYAYVAARNAIAGHLERTELDGAVGFGPPGLYRVVHRVSPATSVALVLAISSTSGLSEAARSWLAQPHPTWHLVLAVPATLTDAAARTLTDAGLDRDRLTTVDSDPDADPATALAAAAEHAHAEHLVLMQAPAIGLTHDWLTRLIGYSAQPGIAAAGPVILSPDGRIHHAGIALPDGIPLHLLHGSRSTMDRHFGFGTSVYNLSAVSGMLATPRALYHKLGGLHPDHRELALIDYCLRAGEHHHRTVIVPDARLRHPGPDTTTNDLAAIAHLSDTHPHTHDPYYNPNYRTDHGDFEPR